MMKSKHVDQAITSPQIIVCLSTTGKCDGIIRLWQNMPFPLLLPKIFYDDGLGPVQEKKPPKVTHRDNVAGK